MRLEMRWKVNEAEMYKTFFFPWSFLNSVTNDTFRLWGLWPEKDTLRSRRFKETDTKSNHSLLLPGSFWTVTTILLYRCHVSITWTEKESAIMFRYLIQREEREVCSPANPTSEKEVINLGTAIRHTAQILFPKSCFKCHHYFAMTWNFDIFGSFRQVAEMQIPICGLLQDMLYL